MPGRRYPVNDASHARNALSRVSANGTPAEKAAVRGKVARKFPSIGRKKKSSTPSMADHLTRMRHAGQFRSPSRRTYGAGCD